LLLRIGRLPAHSRATQLLSLDRPLGRQFGWLWAAFAISTFGTCLAFDAFPLIAILVLHSGPTEVSVLAAAVRRSVGPQSRNSAR
jgi:hypothetical protein